jgi:hypothetical protein
VNDRDALKGADAVINRHPTFVIVVAAALAWWSMSFAVRAAETEYLLGFCTDEERHNDPPKCALRDRVAPPASMLGKEGNQYRNELERCTTSPCPDADAAMRRVIAVEKELRDALDSVRKSLGDDDPWYQRLAKEAWEWIRDARAELPSPKRTDEEASFITQLDGFTFIALRELKKAEEAEKQCPPESTCPEATALVERLPDLRSQLSPIFRQVVTRYGTSDAAYPPFVLRSVADADYGQGEFERGVARLRKQLADRQPLPPLPTDARLVHSTVNTANIREHRFPQDIVALNGSIRDLKVYKTADQLIIEFNTSPLPKIPNLPANLLVRLFDRNGQFLSYFQTKEAYTQFQQFADEGNRKRAAHGSGSAQLERDLPPWSVLKPRGNRLTYTVNRRDLDYTDVVEVGFVIPLLIR